MGNVTADLAIWTPDVDDLGEPDIYLATMASSLESGVGDRLRKQEQIIGCNLGITANHSSTSTMSQVAFAVQSTLSWNFNSGMAISGGSVTIPVDGYYTVNIVANYLSASTTAPRINTYLMLNGSTLSFSSTYGNTTTSRYANATISGTYKLTANQVLAVKTATGDANANLQAGGGSNFSILLVKPL